MYLSNQCFSNFFKQLLILTGYLFVICQANMKAQEPIMIKSGKYYYDGKETRPGTMLNIVHDFPQAHKLIKTGRNRKTVGYILAGLGGYIAGSALGTKIGSGSYSESNPKSNVYVGIAMGVGGVVLSGHGAKRILKGVNLYNSSINQAYIERSRISINFGPTQHGLGLLCKF